MEKKKVLAEIDFDVDKLLTSFDKAANYLIEQKDKLESEGWTSVHLKMNYGYESFDIVAMGMRLETDTEFSARKLEVEKKAIQEAKKIERKRKLFEKLQKEFAN